VVSHVAVCCVIPMPRSRPRRRWRSAILECARSALWRGGRAGKPAQADVAAARCRRRSRQRHATCKLQRSSGCPPMTTRRSEIGRRLALALRLMSTPWSFATLSPRAPLEDTNAEASSRSNRRPCTWYARAHVPILEDLRSASVGRLVRSSGPETLPHRQHLLDALLMLKTWWDVDSELPRVRD
jgi:hypothetical protein